MLSQALLFAPGHAYGDGWKRSCRQVGVKRCCLEPLPVANSSSDNWRSTCHPRTPALRTPTHEGLAVTCICRCHHMRWREAFISLCQTAFHYLLVPQHVHKESRVADRQGGSSVPCAACDALFQMLGLLIAHAFAEGESNAWCYNSGD